MEIVVNRDWGGFSVSKEVFEELGINWDGYGYITNDDLGVVNPDNYHAYRSDARLIAAIKKVGLDKASGEGACLVIREVPDDVDWEIDDYDGMETIHEKHRIW